MDRINLRATLFAILAVMISLAPAAGADPACLDGIGQELPVDNAQVLRWKSTTPNQFLNRAKISGVVQDIYPTKNGHYHFQAKLGPGPKDVIELVYNISFGIIDRIIPGQRVIACGDYITSNAPTSQYEPSPDGAILHWLHFSKSPRKHPAGYLILDDALHGQSSLPGSVAAR